MSAPFDLSVTDALLSTTRAVRKRLDLDREVPRDVILECIGLSQQAPTGSNSQTWRWLVVTDADKRKTIADVYKEGGTTYLEQARSNLAEGDAQTKRVYDSAFWLMDHMHEVPALVIPCVVGRLPDGAPNIMAASVYGSIFPAVWSFQLALRSRGLGSTLTTLHLFKEDVVAKLDATRDSGLVTHVVNFQFSFTPVGTSNTVVVDLVGIINNVTGRVVLNGSVISSAHPAVPFGTRSHLSGQVTNNPVPFTVVGTMYMTIP